MSITVVDVLLLVAIVVAGCLGVLLVVTDRKLSRQRAESGLTEIRCERAVERALAEQVAREAAEQALHGSEARIHAVLEAAVDAIITIDERGRIQRFNRSAERIFQYSAAEVLGNNVSMLMPEPYRSAHDLYLQNYLNTGQAHIIGVGREVAGRRKDGSTFPMHLAVGESRLEGQRIFAGFARDLSARKRAEERLFEAEEKFRLLVDSVHDYAISLIDASGHITSWNAGAAQMHGWTAEEVLGRHISIFFTARERAEGEPERVLAVARHEGSYDGEAPSQHRDGTIAWAHVTLSALLDDAGVLRGYVRIARDLSEQKHHEEALRRAKEEAERANLAKSRFLAAASHDLRQPVQALMFFTSALATRAKDDAGMSMLANLEKSLEGLNSLLESLLEVSKLDAGVITPQPAEFPLATLFDRLRTDFSGPANEKGLDLKVVASGEFVRSDPALLGRILTNLVGNSVRYTSRGKILVGCRKAGDQLRIEVWDTGMGIPPERTDDIFQEFIQLGNPERDRSQGLGLGLAIVKRLAQLLGLDVRVHSVPGRGSLFSVDVPRAPRRELWRRQSVRAEGEDQLVLIIDDETTVLKGLGMILEAWGFKVLAATSEQEALDQLEAHGRRPSAILADYRLRDGHTGTEAARNIRALFDAPIPSIIITGDTAPERLREAEASGFAIIHKPVQPPRLKSMLTRSLDE